MQKHFLFAIGGLMIGLAVGFFAANSINRSAFSRQPAVQNSTATSPLVPGQTVQDTSSGALPEVTAVLERAKNEPNNFGAQMLAGEMYLKIGNLEKAKEFYEKGARLAPNDFSGNVTVANAFFDARDFEKAETFYLRALQFDPKDINARTDLATTFIERTSPDLDRGIAEFNEALKIDPRHEPTLYNLAVAYVRKGDMHNAKLTISRLEEVNQSSPLLARLKESIKAK